MAETYEDHLRMKEMGYLHEDEMQGMKKAQFGFDFAGYLKGEQGFIPDYKGKSTTETYMENKDDIQNVLDKASYVPVLGTAASLGSAAIDAGDAYMAYKDGDYDTMKRNLLLLVHLQF